jgi:hypothetical protein
MAKERKCITSDDNQIYTICPFDSLPDHCNFSELTVPVGSVEFVNEFARLRGISVPDNLSYPVELSKFLKRRIWQDKFSEVNEDFFVKPLKTKAFTGAIKKNLTESVDPEETVWVSEPINFVAEFRYYVLDRAIVGYSRYDGNEEEIKPDQSLAQHIVESFESQPAGYAIDVGVANGETYLIEINDGWSLGYYPWGSCHQRSYVDLITKRWKQITAEKSNA